MDLVELGALEGVVEPLGQRLDRRQVVHAPGDLLHRRHRRVLQVQSDQDHGLKSYDSTIQLQIRPFR